MNEAGSCFGAQEKPLRFPVRLLILRYGGFDAFAPMVLLYHAKILLFNDKNS